jgi:hypothetical protein
LLKYLHLKQHKPVTVPNIYRELSEYLIIFKPLSPPKTRNPDMSERKNKIVVPLDFHEQSMIALDQTRSIARFMDAEIIILYIIESTDIISAMFRKNEEEKIYEEARKNLKNWQLPPRKNSASRFGTYRKRKGV